MTLDLILHTNPSLTKVVQERFRLFELVGFQAVRTYALSPRRVEGFAATQAECEPTLEGAVTLFSARPINAEVLQHETRGRGDHRKNYG